MVRVYLGIDIGSVSTNIISLTPDGKVISKQYLGVFVINSIDSATEQTTNEGDILYIQVEMKLIEYDGKIPEQKESEGGLKTKWPNFTVMSPKTTIGGI